jgi:hypothetical protein
VNSTKIKAAQPAPDAGNDDARARLRLAIAEREAKQGAVGHVEKAVARGRELLRTLESALAKFGDLDAVILQHRAKRVTDAAQAGPMTPDLKLPVDLVEARKARDEAAEQVTAAKFALKRLSDDLARAQRALQLAERSVNEAAQTILVQEAILQAAALKAAWSNVWHLYDTLIALPGSSQQLPADAVRILRLMPGIDHRQFVGGRNPALARAKEGWKAWVEALSKNADAPMPELVDDGASSAAVERVA